jgi:hypothetical protein
MRGADRAGARKAGETSAQGTGKNAAAARGRGIVQNGLAGAKDGAANRLKKCQK